jgi:hypothetical protein
MSKNTRAMPKPNTANMPKIKDEILKDESNEGPDVVEIVLGEDDKQLVLKVQDHEETGRSFWVSGDDTRKISEFLKRKLHGKFIRSRRAWTISNKFKDDFDEFLSNFDYDRDTNGGTDQNGIPTMYRSTSNFIHISYPIYSPHKGQCAKVTIKKENEEYEDEYIVRDVKVIESTKNNSRYRQIKGMVAWISKNEDDTEQSKLVIQNGLWKIAGLINTHKIEFL